jgi:hypothetical protein
MLGLHALLFFIAVVVGGCINNQTGTSPQGSASVPRPAASLDASAPPTARSQPMNTSTGPGGIVRSPLPDPFDFRIMAVLREPVPDDVAIAFLSIAMENSPTSNYRWNLTLDGSLFYVQHSRKPGDWRITFDLPLPSKPGMQLDAAAVQALVAKLEAAGFFEHPGYEANPKTADGSYFVIRARRGKGVHSVVFQNTRPGYVNEIVTLADPLWTQP